MADQGDAGGTHLMHRLSAKFVTPAVEEAYLRHRLQDLLKGIIVCCALMGGMLSLIGLRGLTPSGQATTNEITKAMQGYYLGIGPGLLALAAALRTPAVAGRIGFRTCEGIVLVSLLGSLAVVLCFAASKLREGETISLREELEHALFLDSLITVSHLVLPVRWRVMVWVDVLYVLGYGVQCYFAQSSGAWLRVSVNLAVLVLGASLGFRMQEQAQRALFVMVINERIEKVKAMGFIDPAPIAGPLRGSVQRHSLPGDDITSLVDGGLSQIGDIFPPPRDDMTTSSGDLFRDIMSAPMNTRLPVLRGLGEQEHWLIRPEDLVIRFPVRVLGRGAYGTVVVGSYCHAEVAVKIFADDRGLESCINELYFLRRFRHPNLVAFFGAVAIHDTIKLVLEKVKGQSLEAYLRRLLPECNEAHAIGKVQVVISDVLRALIYLHSRQPSIAHGDLKLSNIYVVDGDRNEVDGDSTVPAAKLLDFGLSRAVTRNTPKFGGTMGFMAPEIREGGMVKPSSASDMFSLGRILSFAATFGQRNLESSPLLDDWRSTILDCDSHDPHERPTATEVFTQLFPNLSQDASRASSSTRPRMVGRKTCSID